MGSKLDERGRRLFAAAEVRAAGWGGVRIVSEVAGLARSTIDRGEDDLDAEQPTNGLHRRAGARLWRIELQKLAEETDLVIHVHHFPSGASKWNKIEHPIFCQLTQSWRGKPLFDHLTIVSLIGATTTRTGL